MGFGTKKNVEPRSVSAPAASAGASAPRSASVTPFSSQAARPAAAFGGIPKPLTGGSSAPATATPARIAPGARGISSTLAGDEHIVSANYYDWKKQIHDAILGSTDMMQRLDSLEKSQAALEIKQSAQQIIVELNFAISKAENEKMLNDLVDDILGFGPLQPLLDRDDIADIMINGPDQVFIEVGGQIETVPSCRFTDEAHLFNIAQRLVAERGRRVDESNPICDSRLNDGSRLCVVVPPIVKNTTITIRKFKRDRLKLEDLVRYGSISPDGAELLKIIGRCRLNVIVSGGTGSGKTTLLNCLSAFIDHRERILTVEDTQELQLQQPHVVPMESRPPSIEGSGEIDIQTLVKTTLRMRPTRILIGEVRGEEMFFLLQAMNTGHAGSMGTLHANDPRGALSRMESMVIMGKPNLNVKNVREMIAESVDLIVQVNRLPDGSRRITHISEITGMEGEVISTQDLLLFKQTGEDERGRVVGHYEFQGIVKPKFYDKAVFFGEGDRLQKILSRSA